MPIEHASTKAMFKPWGRRNLSPWANSDPGEPIGEIWFETSNNAPEVRTELLIKLLFTSQPLSIQVHPDDIFAQLIGMQTGKTEAWYILSAEPSAQVAIGLRTKLTRQELRLAILDGSIASLVNWRNVMAGDIVFVPAGTIHSIGAGLVIAEIQQRCDTTFRLFDYGRGRELHVDQAVAVSDLGPVKLQCNPVRLTNARTHLVSCPFFTLELISAPPNSHLELHVECESWVMVISGGAKFDFAHAGVGEVFLSRTGPTAISVGRSGLKILVAYAASQSAQTLISHDIHDISEHLPGNQDAFKAHSVNEPDITKELLL